MSTEDQFSDTLSARASQPLLTKPGFCSSGAHDHPELLTDPRILHAVGVFVIAGVLRGGSLAVHSVILAAIGAVLFACGIVLAVWARLHLGRNWGMPMTQRAEPELVTSGPYRFVRHPIYTGLLTAMLGTALVNNLLSLIVVAVLVAYFYYCGIIEERNLTATFPTAYPEYKSRTKMLI